MSKARNDLTPAASQGFECADPHDSFRLNPYIKTSPNWFAFQLGAYLKRTGRPMPQAVRMGRGYQIWSGDCLYAFDGTYAITRVQ